MNRRLLFFLSFLVVCPGNLENIHAELQPPENIETIAIIPPKDSSGLVKTAPPATIPKSDSATIPDSMANIPLIDTTFRVWHSPFWGIGIGWEIGSLPVYKQWILGLPTKLIDTVQTLNGDIVFSLPLTNKESPSTYNICFPLSLSVTPFLFGHSFISIAVSLSYITKTFKAALVKDALTTYWSMEKKLNILTPALGASFSYTIPVKYFTISKSQQTLFTAGLSASPYVLLREKTVIEPGNRLSTNSSNGVGIFWSVGLSTLRMLSVKNALQAEFFYTGSWNGHFMNGHHHTTNSDINPANTSASSALEYVSTRFMLKFSLLRTTRDTSKTATESQPAPDGVKK
jgi:hypothetical protein